MLKWVGYVAAMALLMTTIAGCGTKASMVSSHSHAKECPTRMVPVNENGTVQCLATHPVSPLSLQLKISDTAGGIRIQWATTHQENGSHAQMQSVANGGMIEGLAIGTRINIMRVQTQNGIIGWIANRHPITITYGAFALWGNVSAVPSSPDEAILSIQYNKSLPNQIPSQNFSTYHVTAFHSGLPPGHVIKATVSHGQLQLLVQFVSRVGPPLILRTTHSVAHTTGGAPVSSYVVAY